MDISHVCNKNYSIKTKVYRKKIRRKKDFTISPTYKVTFLNNSLHSCAYEKIII